MRVLVIFTFILISLGACRERYGLPLEASREGVLVVEGNILNGDSSKFRLSRTSSINDRRLIPETGATLQIEGEDNSVYALSESEAGVYTSDFLTLNKASRYRLKISSGSGEYESDWLNVITTPQIDSVFWRIDNRDNGVEIMVAGQGNDVDSRYLKWDYDEVWEFHADFESRLYYTYWINEHGLKIYQCIDTVQEGKPMFTCVWAWYPPFGSLRNDSMYTCWKYQGSSNIHIGSTVALSGNTILTPVRKIQDDAWEISVLYSILVKQTGLTKEGYEFYQILKANSEGLGTIFDAQPSQMKTNLRCISNPAEMVIGFIDATTVASKRIFISNKELPGWRYINGFNCQDTLQNYEISYEAATSQELNPTEIELLGKEPPYYISEYRLAPPRCTDCRLRGVHRRPDFWP